MSTESLPKKRGRKKKVVQEDEKITKPASKKYSKKVTDMKDILTAENTLIHKQINLILYLRCSIKDIDQYILDQKWKTDTLTYDPKVPTEFVPFFSSNLIGDKIQNSDEDQESLIEKEPSKEMLCRKCGERESFERFPAKNNTPGNKYQIDNSELQKIRQLKLALYRNDVQNKKVDCFWCTCPFDNEAFYILQFGTNNNILAHDSFCSPECGVAYLFERVNWDDSTKLESYGLMNSFYHSNKEHNTNQNIKPAPNPYYLLDKYYGTLNIQEYRKLSKSSNVMLCIDKPVTRLLPELHEDQEHQSATNTSQNRGNYRVKKQSEKTTTVSRNDILRDAFCVGGISASA
jgi:hypothetical protein